MRRPLAVGFERLTRALYQPLHFWAYVSIWVTISWENAWSWGRLSSILQNAKMRVKNWAVLYYISFDRSPVDRSYLEYGLLGMSCPVCIFGKRVKLDEGLCTEFNQGLVKLWKENIDEEVVEE